MGLHVEVAWGVGTIAPGSGVTPRSGLVPGASTGSNVTDRVRPRTDAITLAYGRDQSTALAPTVSGTGGFTLDNRSRDYSPRNTLSPLYGHIKPARPVTITRVLEGELTIPFIVGPDATLTTDQVFTLFTGHTDDNPINPDVNQKTVTLSLVDSLADFRGQNITTELYSGIRTGRAVSLILDACGWPAELRSLDAGATVIPWWWADNKDALTALEEIIRSEGPPALLTVGADGSIIFKDRHHRLMEPRSLTSQAVWGDIGGSNLYPANTLFPITVLFPDEAANDDRIILNTPFIYDEAWRNIVNDCVVSVDTRAAKDPEAVWTADATFVLTGGEQKVITVATSDPFLYAVAPESGVDYTIVSGAATVSLVRASGASAEITLTDTGGGAIIEGLQLRAQPVSTAYTTQVSASDSTSITDFGARAFPNDLPWCNAYDAQAVLDLTVSARAQPNPIIEVRFMIGQDKVRSAAILSRDMSDLVTVVEPETSLSGDFYIERFQHDLTGEIDHSVTIGLEMAPTRPSPIARTDTFGAGTDQGFLAGTFDDPDSIAITDSNIIGHRVEEGLCAT